MSDIETVLEALGEIKAELVGVNFEVRGLKDAVVKQNGRVGKLEQWHQESENSKTYAAGLKAGADSVEPLWTWPQVRRFGVFLSVISGTLATLVFFLSNMDKF